MAAETNVMQFDDDIDYIFKVNDSLGIIIKRSMMICSPFKVTRPLTGMHNSYFQNSKNIKFACHFYYDCSLAEEFLGEKFPYPKVRESFFLVYDIDQQFIVLDAPRSIIISKFFFRHEHSSPVIGLAGHPSNLGEVAILTANAIFRIHIKLDDYDLISKVPIDPPVNGIRPFLDGYLVQTSTELNLLNDNGLHLYKNIPSNATILTDQSTVACISYLKKTIFKVNILNTGVKFGLMSFQPNLVDICHGYIISFHDSINLSFVNISNPKHHFSTELSQKISDPIRLFAGLNSTMDSIVVVVFAQKFGICIVVPLSNLDSDA